MKRILITSPWLNATPADLAEGLRERGYKVRHLDPRRHATPARIYHKVINWGSSTYPNPPPAKARIYNVPEFVAQAANKLHSYRKLKLKDIPVLEFSTNPADAVKWLAGGSSVFGRAKLTGMNGDGIILFNVKDYPEKMGEFQKQFPECKVFTRNFRKLKEYRIHVLDGSVLFGSQKKRALKERLSEEWDITERPSGYIRSYMNGWVHCAVDVPEKIGKLAVSAVDALALDFGAVDLLDNGQRQVVCEVNTAPGLEGSHLEAYVKGFANLVGKV